MTVKSAHHDMAFTTLVPLFFFGLAFSLSILRGGVVADWLTSFKAGLGIVVS